MERTGHSWIKQAMAEHNAVFAGEMSGHMFFKHSYYGFDDGLYAAVFLIDYIQKCDGSFSDLVARLPKTYCTPEIRIACSEDQKSKTIDILKQKLVLAGKVFNTIDGVRVEEVYGWWLVRASNTQGALIIRAEGNTEKDLAFILNELQAFGINIDAG
jgi:phosphomannomutase